jgi:hypothetical protein
VELRASRPEGRPPLTGGPRYSGLTLAIHAGGAGTNKRGCGPPSSSCAVSAMRFYATWASSTASTTSRWVTSPTPAQLQLQHLLILIFTRVGAWFAGAGGGERKGVGDVGRGDSQGGRCARCGPGAHIAFNLLKPALEENRQYGSPNPSSEAPRETLGAARTCDWLGGVWYHRKLPTATPRANTTPGGTCVAAGAVVAWGVCWQHLRPGRAGLRAGTHLFVHFGALFLWVCG